MINIKADSKVKEEAQRIAEDLGLTLSAVVNASLKQFVRTKEVYFSLSPRLKPEIETLIAEAKKDHKEGKNISPTFASAKSANIFLDTL